MSCPLAAAVDGGLVDGAVLVALLLFLLWGALQGLVRQALGLAVVGAAFAAASAFAPGIEAHVAKVADLSPDGLASVAWLVLFAAVMVAGGVVLHLVGGWLSVATGGGRTARGLGALLALVKGALVVGVVLYAALGATLGASGPNLVLSVRASRAARVLPEARRVLSPLLRLPPGVAMRLAAVDAEVRAGEAP